MVSQGFPSYAPPLLDTRRCSLPPRGGLTVAQAPDGGALAPSPRGFPIPRRVSGARGSLLARLGWLGLAPLAYVIALLASWLLGLFFTAELAQLSYFGLLGLTSRTRSSLGFSRDSW